MKFWGISAILWSRDIQRLVMVVFFFYLLLWHMVLYEKFWQGRWWHLLLSWLSYQGFNTNIDDHSIFFIILLWYWYQQQVPKLRTLKKKKKWNPLWYGQYGAADLDWYRPVWICADIAGFSILVPVPTPILHQNNMILVILSCSGGFWSIHHTLIGVKLFLIICHS